ncbi:MAG: helix-turn-helix domain-containing protein, partial [Oscillospiraceae bacterium]|nr:helix-turn-helix domain-containing protein [Oscillospiraceae bacterium]
MANKAYRYRIYPNDEQQTLLAKTFGCVRFVYNKCLDEHERRHAGGEKFASRVDMNNFCVRTLKKEYPFLKEVDKFALTNAVFHLDEGYRRMFRRQGGHPKYKSRHKSKASYTTNFTNGNIKVFDNAIQIPKVGRIKAVIHRKAPDNYSLKSATVSMERDGTYYVSVLYEYDSEPV